MMFDSPPPIRAEASMPVIIASAAELRLVRLRALQLEAGSITSVQRDTSPTFTAPDGRVHEDLPPRTVVKMLLHPADDSNIQVELWLPEPDRWNSRMLGLGNGGAAGNINPGRLAPPLADGFAVTTTDMGTAPDPDSGVGNPEVWKDFGFRATHVMTVAAKQVIQTYYGKAPDYSYFYGGSTGGQQALQEAQRFPDDYDGIVANVPAHCRVPLHAYFLWNHQILLKRPFSESQQSSVISAGNEYMAARETPAAAGKFISDPRCDRRDIEAIIALALRKDPTLTEEHAEALRKLYDGPRHALTGERVFGGIPVGAPFLQACGHLYLFKWVFGPDKNPAEIDFRSDIDTYSATLGPFLNAEDADLSRFEKRGGKLIMMSGSVDPIVPVHATIDYYERVVASFGGLEKTQAFFRFYIIPGMAHSGGPGINQPPDMVEAVRAWREQGVAPEVVFGRRIVDGKQELQMPIYPYPLKAGWDAAAACFHPVEGPRGGGERIAERFLRPPSAE